MPISNIREKEANVLEISDLFFERHMSFYRIFAKNRNRYEFRRF